jgi:hypothetical protein
MSGMEKPELLIEYTQNNDLLQGRCSSCPHTVFNLKGDNIEQKMVLRQMFDLHCKRVHKHGGASQAKDVAKSRG